MIFQNYATWRNALLLSIGLAILGCFTLANSPEESLAQPKGTNSKSETSVTVSVNFPNGTSITVPNVPAPATCPTNVRLAMLNANYLNPKLTFQTSYYYPYGDYVTEINGWYGGSSNYWALYINGNAAPCGIDTQILQAGDTVTWYLVSTSSKKHDAKAFQAKVHKHRSKKFSE